jgi:hypothetical protein
MCVSVTLLLLLVPICLVTLATADAHVPSIEDLDLWKNETQSAREARMRLWSYVLGWQTHDGFNETYNFFPRADQLCDGLKWGLRNQSEPAGAAGAARFELDDEHVKNVTKLARQLRWIANTERSEALERLRARASAEDRDAAALLAAVENGTAALTIVADDEEGASDERKLMLRVRREVRASWAALDAQASVDMLSYTYGVEVANNFGFGPLGRNWTLESDVLCNALRARLRGEPMILTGDQYDANVEQMRDDFRMLIFRRKYYAELLKTNRWFVDNAANDNIYTDGKLQYEILKRGSVATAGGRRPTLRDDVRVTFKLMQRDDTVIAENVGKEPKQYRMADVLPAWRMALLQMLPGDKWRLYMHPDLAYGALGFQRKVKPGGVSICELELVQVLAPQKSEL